MVESVSAWVVAEVRVGDILVAVDGKKMTSLAQINKFVRQAGERVPLRLERKLKILPTPSSDDKVKFNENVFILTKLGLVCSLLRSLQLTSCAVSCIQYSVYSIFSYVDAFYPA